MFTKKMMTTIANTAGRIAFQPAAIKHAKQPPRLQKNKGDLEVCFVHTPMATTTTNGREQFWKNFDMRYYATHEELRPVDASIWELPHWMTWLGGILKASGYNNIKSLSLYTAANVSEGIDREFIDKDIRDNPADIYLFSPMTPNLHYAFDIARMIKERIPHAISVFGGVISSPLHVKVSSHPDVDYVIRDRGEIALPALLSAICHEGDIQAVKNVSYSTKDGHFTHSEVYPRLAPAEIAFPYYDLFDSSVGNRLRYIRQNYALGCPFECSFCTIQTIGQKPGYFPIERVLSEIKAYRSHYGEYHNVYFGDETFTLDKERTLAICEALRIQGNVTYDIQTRLMSLTNQKVLSALKESGCRWVEVGIETLTQTSSNIHKQRTNVLKAEEILKRLRDIGLPVCSFMVNGFPDQTLDEMRRNVDGICELIDKQLLHATYFNGLVPYPGSLIYKNPDKYGIRIRHHEYDKYNEDLPPVYDTAHATSEEIYDVYLEGTLKIAQAMSGKPYLGNDLSPDVIVQLGKSATHV